MEALVKILSFVFLLVPFELYAAFSPAPKTPAAYELLLAKKLTAISCTPFTSAPNKPNTEREQPAPQNSAGCHAQAIIINHKLMKYGKTKAAQHPCNLGR